MERETKEIKREIEFLWKDQKYLQCENDRRGETFGLGMIAGLSRSLEILEGGEALVDDEIEAWYDENYL